MPIHAQCPKCKTQLVCPDHMAGMHGRCSICQTAFIIPAGPAQAASAPPRAPATDNLAALSAAVKEQGVAPGAAPARPATAKDEYGGFFGPEKKGISKGAAGGLAMMAIAVVWFVVGYAAGVIFFYPPVLFAIGVFALLKGLATGNLAGEKSQKA